MPTGGHIPPEGEKPALSRGELTRLSYVSAPAFAEISFRPVSFGKRAGSDLTGYLERGTAVRLDRTRAASLQLAVRFMEKRFVFDRGGRENCARLERNQT